MSAAQPLVTVVMPTHDHGMLVHSAVRSALAQSHSNFELLVIGDGVPDETRYIFAKYQQSDSRIAFFDYPKGPRHGEYIVTMSCYPGQLARLSAISRTMAFGCLIILLKCATFSARRILPTRCG